MVSASGMTVPSKLAPIHTPIPVATPIIGTPIAAFAAPAACGTGASAPAR